MATSIKTIKNHLTDDTIYPVTKANAVYLSDDVTTVEAALNNKIKHIQFQVSASYSAGTIGTRGAQIVKTLEELDLNHSDIFIIGMEFMYVGASIKYIPIIFHSLQSIYINLYRASTEAVTSAEGTLTVRISYYSIF